MECRKKAVIPVYFRDFIDSFYQNLHFKEAIFLFLFRC